jgi:hypothetical protein
LNERVTDSLPTTLASLNFDHPSEIVGDCTIVRLDFASSDPDFSIDLGARGLPLELRLAPGYPTTNAVALTVIASEEIPRDVCLVVGAAVDKYAALLIGKPMIRDVLRWLDRNLEQLILLGMERKTLQHMSMHAHATNIVPPAEFLSAVALPAETAHPVVVSRGRGRGATAPKAVTAEVAASDGSPQFANAHHNVPSPCGQPQIPESITRIASIVSTSATPSRRIDPVRPSGVGPKPNEIPPLARQAPKPKPSPHPTASASTSTTMCAVEKSTAVSQCKFGINCRNIPKCKFLHPTLPVNVSAASLSVTLPHPLTSAVLSAPLETPEVQTSTAAAPCKFGSKCRNGRCKFVHPAPTVAVTTTSAVPSDMESDRPAAADMLSVSTEVSDSAPEHVSTPPLLTLRSITAAASSAAPVGLPLPHPLAGVGRGRGRGRPIPDTVALVPGEPHVSSAIPSIAKTPIGASLVLGGSLMPGTTAAAATTVGVSATTLLAVSESNFNSNHLSDTDRSDNDHSHGSDDDVDSDSDSDSDSDTSHQDDDERLYAAIMSRGCGPAGVTIPTPAPEHAAAPATRMPVDAGARPPSEAVRSSGVEVTWSTEQQVRRIGKL